ncbi:protein translocase subunit SecD [Isosphaeraceae bacterium EP7]
MKNFTQKFTLIGGLTALFLLFIYVYGLKPGIDLSGGTILVYEVNNDSGKSNANIDDLITALKRRINPDGVLDRPIRKIGSNRIELILSEASDDEVEDVKRKMTDVGSLEFRILANRYDARAQAIAKRAYEPGAILKPPAGHTWAKLGETITGTAPVSNSGGTTLTDASQRWTKNAYVGLPVEITGKDAAGLDRTVAPLIKENTADSLTLETPHGLASVASYKIEKSPSNIGTPPKDSTRQADPIVREETVAPGRVERYILCQLPPERQNVTGQYLARVYSTQDEKMQPAVGFVFDRAGARKFGSLTSSHLPKEGGAFHYQLAILLDNVVMSAPQINSEIRETGVIEGGGQGFRAKEVDNLVEILRSGSLPASLNPNPLQEEKIGPTLGEDTIAKGIFAIELSMLVVPLFMIAYYRFAGLVAVVALVLNMVLLLGSMALFRATFTLPGLAGLALTIGMAVDANVLIFERMREEAERGAGLAQQIRNGFSRAWTTILDANITTMLSGFVLYFVGTEEVKGFALTLIIGLIWNLFTAVYVSRVIFDFCYSKGYIRKLTMMKMMDKTNIDFIRYRRACMVGSTIVIAVGLALVYMRGNTMYNIDFTGGTLVTIRLNPEDPEVRDLTGSRRAEFVREKAAGLPDVTVETLNIGGEKAGLRYNIRTTEQDVAVVSAKIQDAFKGALRKIVMTLSEPAPIATAPAPVAGTTPAPASRFAGGRQYTLTFNSEQPPSRIASAFEQSLNAAKVINPTSRFEVVNPKATAGSPDLSSTTLVVRTDLEPEVAGAQLKALAAQIQSNPNLLYERLEKFGAVVAGETKQLAVIATIASWLIIAAYLWLRFKSLTYGLAAIIAVVHDVLFTLGAVAASYWLSRIPGFQQYLGIEPFKIDLPMIAAFLTLIGFSVNDTIVIFDRIREIRGKTPVLTAAMINEAVNQTLSRTILTSLTAWLVVVILYAFGGEGLHGFAFSLVVGFLSGTYSTIYIAAPILVDWIGEKPAEAAARELAAATKAR